MAEGLPKLGLNSALEHAAERFLYLSKSLLRKKTFGKSNDQCTLLWSLKVDCSLEAALGFSGRPARDTCQPSSDVDLSSAKYWI
ncbi:hypothetical protein N7489_008534 [Penicillium chrysogenum]|uniref:Uncharacterized protein n=1 Tax=Penicillium chrysogenum TaxID=5076 RepID=A0ABQ8X0Z3_PENCH|nr:uncharacterized protein N7489_008534 [Penicillium chrysogenum]KAJ5227826.1 hypothetical protein N7489_008534 [Penicillium chrysogenum]KAJ5284541.1 hypothetical protein N7505_002521 [Penicillium chrysogenum]KAJ5286448.1 hypothetical protein N7524_001754 [Penicillium chrysogenum]KAJ6167328.1 hypothetical protein N7497_000171 [Penicillium chrysogenum]